MVTLYDPFGAVPIAMVPVIAPVLGLMLRPGGKPTAPKLSVPPLASVALSVRDTTSPSILSCVPGFVSVIGLFTVQVNITLLPYMPSPTMMITLYCPIPETPRAIVPVISPVLVLILRPAGRPTAPKTRVPLPE